jgi:non-homologous end joining protein Ku
MALDVYLQADSSLPKTTENRFLELEEDGYYCFLQSFFKELSKQTDQVIDYCEDAFFDGKDLELFNQMIEQVKTEISRKPDTWEEFIGTIIHENIRGKEKAKKQYSIVHKKELQSILATLEKAVAKAKKQNLGIFFFGD